MNTALVTNSAFYLEQEIRELTDGLTMKELNVLNIREKLALEDFENYCKAIPFIDAYKVVIFDISLYSIKEIKEIIGFSKNVKSVKTLGFYFIKDKLDKIDPKLKKLFIKENNFTLKTKTTIDKTIVTKILKERNLNISLSTFELHDNMDSVINDINKISYLNYQTLSNSKELKKYLSESFDSNVFELIDSLLSKDVDKTLKQLEILLSTKNEFEINIIILKQLILLRFIKNGEDNKSAPLKEKFSGGKGSPIHPYRFNKLKHADVKINLDFAINELLSNDSKKKFDLELSILKILNAGA